MLKKVFSKKIIRIVCLIVVFILLCIALSITGGEQVFFYKKNKKVPIYYVKREDKRISISFDCAWGTDYTDSLLETMESCNVRCTFFMVEFWVKKHPDYVAKIHQKGHDVGTHSSTHPYMSKLSKDAVMRELQSSISAIETVIGEKPTLFRAPYGDYNDQLLDCASELGLKTIQWDVDSLDWKDLSSKEIETRVVKKVKSGSIVLFHNQGLHTHQALENIIKSLVNQGYTFVPISELVYKDNYTIASDGGQMKNL